MFNFSFKGYGISENYFLINAIINSDVDLIVYNLSTSWFNRTTVLEHPNVVHLSDYPDPAEFKKFNINTILAPRERAGNIINFLVSKIWAFYRYRSDITVGLLGKPLREAITDVQLRITDPAKLKQKQLDEAQVERK